MGLPTYPQGPDPLKGTNIPGQMPDPGYRPDGGQVQKTRQFLISQGYNLAPTGDTIGPLMKEALADWHSGVGSRNPKAWNSKYADPGHDPSNDRHNLVTQTAQANHQTHTNVVVKGKPNVAPTSLPKSKVSAAGPKIIRGKSGGGGGGGGMNRLMASFGGSSNDAVQKLAQSMTNAQYTAPMDLLQSQMDAETKADKTRQTDIGNWFQNVLDQNKTGNQNDIKGSDELTQDSNGLAANILKSLGSNPDAAAQIGKANVTAEGLLSALNQNQQDYGRTMNTALALSGRDAQNADSYQSKQTTKGLVDQLMALTQQKGQSLAANLSAAQDQILKDKAQKINNFATLAMLNPQMNAAKLANAYTRSRIGYTDAQAKAANQAQKAGAGQVDVGKIQASVMTQLPMGSTPGTLAEGTGYSQVGSTIAATLKGAGIKKGTPLYKSTARSIAMGLKDAHGRPVWPKLQHYFS